LISLTPERSSVGLPSFDFHVVGRQTEFVLAFTLGFFFFAFLFSDAGELA
jgi:hypothetical protein